MKQKKETDLGREPIGRLLFRLSVPAITVYRPYSRLWSTGPDRCGCYFSADHADLRICGTGEHGRRAPFFYYDGKGKER